MSDSYTTNLRIVQQTNGENAGVWGDRVDAAFTMLESAICDVVPITLTGTTYTLSTANNSADEARGAVLEFSGSPGGTCTVTIPDVDKVYAIKNGSDQSITLTKGSGTTLTLVASDRTIVYCKSGTGVFDLRGGNVLALAGLTGAANKLPYFTGSQAMAVTDLTATAITLLDDTSTSAMRTTLGLVIGTDVLAPSGSGASLTGIRKQGTETIWIPAAAMIAQTTAGPSTGGVETSTNKVMIRSLDFDKDTQEHAQFQIRMPKSWNESTITASFVWSHASTATNFGVVWGIQGLALSDTNAQDTAFGTAQTVTDTGGTTDACYISAATSAITIGNTPAAQDYVVFQVYRKAADASDTLAVDARLQGVSLFFTTDAADDT